MTITAVKSSLEFTGILLLRVEDRLKVEDRGPLSQAASKSVFFLLQFVSEFSLPSNERAD
jgi:hypothetical protein